MYCIVVDISWVINPGNVVFGRIGDTQVYISNWINSVIDRFDHKVGKEAVKGLFIFEEVNK